MNLRTQLIRATAALAVIGGLATAETLSPPVPDCPFAKAAKPQRILLLDPIQKHPTWIDARIDSSNPAVMHAAVETARDDDAKRGVVTL